MMHAIARTYLTQSWSLSLCLLLAALNATAQDARPKSGDRPTLEVSPISPKRQRLEARLDEDNEAVDFADVTLREVMTFLQQQWGTPIIIDAQALANASATLESKITLKLPAGVVTRRDMMDLLLDPLGLFGRPREGVVILTAKDDAMRFLETKVYDCRPLLEHWSKSPSFLNARQRQDGHGGGYSGGYSGPDNRKSPVPDESKPAPAREQNQRFQDVAEFLSDIIINSISTDNWNDNGGQCSIEVIDGLLVITASQAIHRDVHQLVRTMHDARVPPAKPNRE